MAIRGFFLNQRKVSGQNDPSVEQSQGIRIDPALKLTAFEPAMPAQRRSHLTEDERVKILDDAGKIVQGRDRWRKGIQVGDDGPLAVNALYKFLDR